MKILVVDDHQLFLDGLRHTLTQLGSDTEVLTSSDAAEAMAVIDDGTTVDLILLDMIMPGMDGNAFLQGLAERHLLIPVVAISAEMNPRLVRNALGLGALGYIPKSHSARQMLAAIRDVLAGVVYLPPDVLRAVRRLERRGVAPIEDENSPHFSDITPRQHDVLQLMAKGYSNKTIATTLHVTENTVKSHITVLLQVLTANNRTECVLEARRRGLIIEQYGGSSP